MMELQISTTSMVRRQLQISVESLKRSSCLRCHNRQQTDHEWIWTLFRIICFGEENRQCQRKQAMIMVYLNGNLTI